MLALFCGALIAASMLPASAAEEAYDPNIMYSATAGDVYAFAANSSSRERSLSRIEGELFGDSPVESSTTLAGQVEFLVVSDDGAVMRMQLRVSDDAGARWRDGPVLYDASAAYSDLVLLDGDAIGCLFEADGYRRVVFTRVPLAALDPDSAGAGE